MATFYSIFCPVCFNSHGSTAERHATKHYIKLGQHNFWEDAIQHHVEEFGVIQESQGRGILTKTGYFSPEEDPTGSYPLVKACLLKATREWLDKGWLDVEEIYAMIRGDIEIPAAPRTKKTVRPQTRPFTGTTEAKTARTKKTAVVETRPPTSVVTRIPPVMKFDIKELRSQLSGWMNEDDKAKSIKALEKALAGVDEDRVDISDVESAIEEYKEITRAGMSPDEYQDAKQTAFEFIQEQIDDLQENENYGGEV